MHAADGIILYSASVRVETRSLLRLAGQPAGMCSAERTYTPATAVQLLLHVQCFQLKEATQSSHISTPIILAKIGTCCTFLLSCTKHNNTLPKSVQKGPDGTFPMPTHT